MAIIVFILKQVTDNVGMLIDRPKSADVDGGLSRPASDPAARTWWHWACDRAGSVRGGGGGRAPPNTPRTTPLPRLRTEPTITYLISLLKSCSVIGDYEWLGFPPIPPSPSPQHPLPSFILLSPDWFHVSRSEFHLYRVPSRWSGVYWV